MQAIYLLQNSRVRQLLLVAFESRKSTSAPRQTKKINVNARKEASLSNEMAFKIYLHEELNVATFFNQTYLARQSDPSTEQN